MAHLHRGEAAGDGQETTTEAEEVLRLAAGRLVEGAFHAAVAGPSHETEDESGPYPESETISLLARFPDLEAVRGQMRGNNTAFQRIL